MTFLKNKINLTIRNIANEFEIIRKRYLKVKSCLKKYNEVKNAILKLNWAP